MGQWPGRMGRRWRLVESWWRGWRLDKPPELWWWRFMGQSVVSEASIRGCAFSLLARAPHQRKRLRDEQMGNESFCEECTLFGRAAPDRRGSASHESQRLLLLKSANPRLLLRSYGGAGSTIA